jgi:hypothetical protein
MANHTTASSVSSDDTKLIPADILTTDDKIDKAIASDDLEHITDCVTEIINEHDSSHKDLKHDPHTSTS